MGDLGSTPGLGGSPGEAKDYPLQYSDLENSRTAQSIGSQSWTQLSDFHLVLLEDSVFSKDQYKSTGNQVSFVIKMRAVVAL